MRNVGRSDALVVRAIAGLHVVTLAWDFRAGHAGKRDGLLGFAIERAELDGNGGVVERYYLRAMTRFKDKDEGLPIGSLVPTSEHPIQSFQWGDYTVKPGRTYRYRVVPMYGKPKLLEPDDDAAAAVEITSEAEAGGAGDDGTARHDIYFNRGVAGSQAYARKFGDTLPDETDPESEQMRWLSRGLFEALIGFIGRAAGGDAADYQLRAMLYEFRYLPVAKAFAAARKAGAAVDIRYEAQSYAEHNEETITSAKIKNITAPQKVREGIRHNKFIVLIHQDVPVAVWTGSTNISAGGIFGHSNVGHIIWDGAIAQRFLDYWDRLADDDVTRAPLLHANLEVEPTPALGKKPPKNRILTLFSPRDQHATMATFKWYAGLMDSARQVMCMTFAFNLDQVFCDVLLKQGKTLRYAVFDKNLKSDVEEQINQVRNTVIASGAKLDEDDLELFLGEQLTGFNRNLYIHDKFMLIDPLGDDPIVATGTANFSGASQKSNDENMLIIRGDTRVADIYFGEFMRIFDHIYARYLVGVIRKTGTHDPDAGFLKNSAAEWVPGHFKPGRKQLRREYFLAGET